MFCFSGYPKIHSLAESPLAKKSPLQDEEVIRKCRQLLTIPDSDSDRPSSPVSDMIKQFDSAFMGFIVGQRQSSLKTNVTAKRVRPTPVGKPQTAVPIKDIETPIAQLRSPTKSDKPTQSSPAKSPEKSAAKSPEKSAAEAPEKSAAEAPAKSAAEAPAKPAAEAPAKPAAEAPAKPAAEAPAKPAAEALADNAPAKSAAEAPEKSVVKAAVTSVVKSPEKSIVKVPEKSVVRVPEKSVVESPKKVAESFETLAAKSPEQATAKLPEVAGSFEKPKAKSGNVVEGSDKTLRSRFKM